MYNVYRFLNFDNLRLVVAISKYSIENKIMTVKNSLNIQNFGYL